MKKIFTVLVLMMVAAVSVFAQQKSRSLKEESEALVKRVTEAHYQGDMSAFETEQRGLFLDYENETITVRELGSLDEEEVKNGFYFETTDGVFRLYQGKVYDTTKASLRDAVTSFLPTTNKFSQTESLKRTVENMGKHMTEEQKKQFADLIAKSEENDRKHEGYCARNARMLAQLDEALNELYDFEADDWR